MAAELDPQIGLRNLIRDTVKRRRRAQPEDIAAAVVDKTPHDLIYAFYEEALRPFVADVMRLDRNAAIDTIRNRSRRTDRPLSPNIEAIRAIDWERVFCSRVATATGWRELGNCTADELEYCAAQRRRDAELTFAQADFYEDLARRLRKHHVATPRDLNAKDLP